MEQAWDHSHTPVQWYGWSCSDSRQRSRSVWKLIRLQDRPVGAAGLKLFSKSNSESFPAESQRCYRIIHNRLSGASGYQRAEQKALLL